MLKSLRKGLAVWLGILCCILLPTGRTFAQVEPVKVETSAEQVQVSEEEYAEEQARIVDAAENGGITVDSYNDCTKWVFLVLQAAGYENIPFWAGSRYWAHFGSEEYTDPYEAPVGAIMIGTGIDSDVDGSGYYYGHVGICVKNEDGELLIRDCVGPGSEHVHTQTYEDWLRWQVDPYIGYEEHEPGFVGWIYIPDLLRAKVKFTWP